MGMNSAVSCWSGQQPCDSEQIVGGADQIGVDLYPLAATVARFTQAADGLHPAEDLLDPLAYRLTHRVAGMTRGAAVKCGAAGATLIARDVRGDLERAARRDELPGVITLVGPKCNPPAARQLRLQHRPGAFALGVAVSRFDRELHRRPLRFSISALAE
jgi:hypothetical protein